MKAALAYQFNKYKLFFSWQAQGFHLRLMIGHGSKLEQRLFQLSVLNSFWKLEVGQDSRHFSTGCLPNNARVCQPTESKQATRKKQLEQPMHQVLIALWTCFVQQMCKHRMVGIDCYTNLGGLRWSQNCCSKNINLDGNITWKRRERERAGH